MSRESLEKISKGGVVRGLNVNGARRLPLHKGWWSVRPPTCRLSAIDRNEGLKPIPNEQNCRTSEDQAQIPVTVSGQLRTAGIWGPPPSLSTCAHLAFNNLLFSRLSYDTLLPSPQRPDPFQRSGRLQAHPHARQSPQWGGHTGDDRQGPA